MVIRPLGGGRNMGNVVKTVDISKLREILERESKSISQEMLYKDAFATGCFLHRAGERRAGRKLCYGVLDALGFYRRKTYFSEILEGLPGNEIRYSKGLAAHHEINKLFHDSDDPE